MTARERLPNRRASETRELTVAGLGYTCTVSRYADGRIAEIFLTNHKKTTQRPTSARVMLRSRSPLPSSMVPTRKQFA
jgi:hypothetical protein